MNNPFFISTPLKIGTVEGLEAGHDGTAGVDFLPGAGNGAVGMYGLLIASKVAGFDHDLNLFQTREEGLS